MKTLALALGALIAFPTLAQDRAAAAREASARGDMDAAIAAMEAHLAAQPDDAAGKKDLARYYIWTGAYRKADALLSPMAAQDPEAASLLAYNLAWAGKPDQAMALNAPGLAADPNALQANYTQAIALRQTAQAYRAWPYVEAAAAIRPGKDVDDLRRGTRVRTASEVVAGWNLFDDSDDIRAERFGLTANVRLSDDWHLLGGWNNTEYRAPIGGGYEPVSGGDRIDDRQYWLGVAFTPAGDTRISAQLGRSETDFDDDTTGLLRVDQRVNDDLGFSAGFDRNRLGISPRSVSLGLMRDQFSGQIHYTPGYRWTFDAFASYQDIDDGNNRSEWQLAARRAVVRSKRLQLDLGGEVQWLSFDNPSANGYYAPDSYKRAALTASAYFPLSDNVGLYARAGAGMQRDESFGSWKSANDLSVELIAGIFSDWELRVSAGYSDRAQQTGLYDANSFGVQLKRRF